MHKTGRYPTEQFFMSLNVSWHVCAPVIIVILQAFMAIKIK